MKFSLSSVLGIFWTATALGANLNSILPEPYKIPKPPSSNRIGCSTCPFSNKSSSVPKLNYLTYANYKINLQEEEDILPSQLLEVHFGSSTPFSPGSRYLLHPPGSKSGFKDYLLVELVLCHELIVG